MSRISRPVDGVRSRCSRHDFVAVIQTGVFAEVSGVASDLRASDGVATAGGGEAERRSLEQQLATLLRCDNDMAAWEVLTEDGVKV